MKLATRARPAAPALMRFVLKLLANLTDPRGGDAMDRIINGLTRAGPRGVTSADRGPCVTRRSGTDFARRPISERRRD